MSLINTITENIKDAMRAKDTDKLTTLRGIKSAFINELVATGKTPQEEVTDAIALTVLKKQAKQRKDSIEQFKKGGREDLVENEEKELIIIESYLPETMSKEEIQKIAEAKKTELGVTDKKDMGKFMGSLMKELGDKADGSDVKDVVAGLFE